MIKLLENLENKRQNIIEDKKVIKNTKINYGITQFMSLEFFEINKNINLNDK